MRRQGKRYNAIMNLPEKPVMFIVYNEDMVKGTEDMINELRGPEFMKYVTVVAKGNTTRRDGPIYFDPWLYDLLGNGNG